MSGKLGKFMTEGFTSWKGMTMNNHLGVMFRTAPQKASNFMIQLLAYKYGRTTETLLQKLPVKEFDTDDEYTWDIVGSSSKNVPLIEARDINGTQITSGMVGANMEPFYLVFPEDWFAHGEIIVGELNEVYPIRIVGEPRMEGTNTIYKCEVWGSAVNGIPAEEVSYGKRFSVDTAFVEQALSRKVGDVRFSAPISMRNEFSTVRIQHKVPGNMLGKKLKVGVPIVDESGKQQVFEMWTHYVDFQTEVQFSDYKNNALMFGRSNRNSNGEYLNIGDSGTVIKTGAGLNALMGLLAA